MKRGQIVAKKSGTKRLYGSIVETEMREKWQFLKVQWVEALGTCIPIEDKSVWLRHDEVSVIDPFVEMTNVQRAMTLSSALLSENYRKVLEKQNGKKKKKRK